MKKLIMTVMVITIAVLGCTSDDKKGTEVTSTSDTTVNTSSDTGTTSSTSTASAAPIDSATMMKNWQAYATPGEPHAMMTKWNGTWTGKATMWMAPGAPPTTSNVTGVNKMIYGGRYQQSTHSGDMMGMKFEGESIMGYNNAKKRFESAWFDNMGTGIVMMEGPWDEATKTLTLTGKTVDPTRMDGSEMTMRQVMRVIDDNQMVVEMYGPGPDGREYKNMEIALTRK